MPKSNPPIALALAAATLSAAAEATQDTVNRVAAPAARAAAQGAMQAGEQAAQAARVVQRNVTDAATGMLGISGERMSKVDTAWLRMDTDSNLMMIVGVWSLQPAIGYDDLCERVRERLLQFGRFRQKVVEDAAGATWVEDTQFDMAQHVLRATLELAPDADVSTPNALHAAQQIALQELVGDLAMQPLNPKRPLWQMHLVEDCQGGSALVVRIHHCIADGIALISVMMSMVDGGALPARKRKAAGPAFSLAWPSDPEAWIADTLIKPLTKLAMRAIDAAGENASRSLKMMRDPTQGMAGSMEAARVAFQVVSDAAALAVMPDDSKTRLKGKPGYAKRVAWCDPIPLDDVKAVGKALGGSVNDVLLACVGGAIGEYLRGFGDDPTGQEIRAMIPVNLRPLEQAYKLGNRFGLVPLVLPIGIDDPVARVYEVRRRMGALKGSTQPLLAFGLLSVAGFMVKPAQDAMLNLFAKKTTAVMTNVPGPRDKMRFCGSTLEQSMFWVPQSGDIGLGVSILSYGGGVQFGVITDTKLCPEPQKIIDEFAPEFARLHAITMMLPWPEGEGPAETVKGGKR